MQYTGYVIQAGHDVSSAYVVLDADPPKEVDKVRITDANGAEYFRQAHETGLDKGDAQVVKSGKSYKITGHLPRTHGSSQEPAPGGGSVSIGTIVPFEIDATCP
jgi:hypothetical protein